MATNPYFNHITEKKEQKLYEDLIIESVQIGGHDVYYIPREDFNVDSILGESFQTTFRVAKPIEVFFTNVESYGGQGDLMTKFGLSIQDDLSFRVSRKRFNEEMGTMRERPREGDLIFIGNINSSKDSFINSIFELTFVETETPWWNLGKSFVYECKTQRFSFNHEKFDTGKSALDSFAKITEDCSSIDTIDNAIGEAINKALEEKQAIIADFSEKNVFGDF